MKKKIKHFVLLDIALRGFVFEKGRPFTVRLMIDLVGWGWADRIRFGVMPP